VGTDLQLNIYPTRQDSMWFDYVTANHHRLFHGQKMYVTTDDWATKSDNGAITPEPISFAPWAGADMDQMLVGLSAAGPPGIYHVIGALYGEADTTVTGIAGTNVNIPPYTDAIPYSLGNQPCERGIRALQPTVGKIYTNAVAMPGYSDVGEDRGVPIPGDRGAWNAKNYPLRHTNDINEGIHHTLEALDLRYGGGTSPISANVCEASNGPPFYLPIATNGRVGESTYPWQQNGILYGNGKTFVFYMADDDDNWCVVYDHETQKWDAPIEVADGHADDIHNYLSAVFDADGYIHIFYGCHDTPLYYKKSTNPYDISSWSVETSLDSLATYPKALVDSSGAIYIFYRSNNVEMDHNRYLKFRRSIDGGASWSAAATIIDSGNDHIWVYAGIIGLGSDDSIHIVWTWNSSTGFIDPIVMHDVCYMKSLDGGTTWEKSTGVDYVLPADPADAEYIATGQYLLAMQVALDEDNNPQVVYIESDPGSWFLDNDIHYCYLSGGVWQDDVITGTGYAFGTHIQVDGSVFYIFSSQLVLGIDEIVMLQSLDSGATWTLYQLTNGSAVNNFQMTTKTNPNGGIEIAWSKGTDIWYMSEDWIIQQRLNNANTNIALGDLTDVNIPSPNDGDVPTFDSVAGKWVNKAPIGGTTDPVFQVEGALAVLTDVDGVYICPRTATILAAYIYCRDPGSASSTIVDVNLNGNTIFTTQANRPTLAWNDANQVAKSGTPNLTAVVENDVLSIDIDQVATGAEDLTVIIAMNVGGTGVPVIARYTTNAAQNIPDSTDTIIDFEDVVYDTDSAVTTGAAWKFTCPTGKAGYYRISASVLTASIVWVVTKAVSWYIYLNGAQYCELHRWVAMEANDFRCFLGGSDIIYLSAGDFIDIRIHQASGAGLALINNGIYNYVSINRID